MKDPGLTGSFGFPWGRPHRTPSRAVKSPPKQGERPTSRQLVLTSRVSGFVNSILASRLGPRGTVVLILAGIVACIYLNSLGNGFVEWDDPGLILRNRQIRSLEWSNIKEIFSVRRASTYQPIRVLSYAVDYHFWKLNPLGYHITNIAFYLLTCILVFFFAEELLKFLRREGTPQSNTRIAFLAALLFAVHPVHVESVTWLSARKEVLVGFFFFASLYCYLKATDATRRETKSSLYGLAFLCFVMAVLSKPVAVALPGI
ncbi:MAG: hypothetical protein JRJ26_20460, partial [Deltaproteobacteria bacterium]|nr:hypothetical protein [Deltaproteobacteria bacterium]